MVHSSQRGQLKQLLLKLGWPAEDLAGYVDGTPHPILLDESGWKLRPYQQLAMENFWAGGSGVVVLPCGAGKTLVGAAAMATSSTTTLILVTNTVSARQWKDELLKRTSLTEEEIGEYSGSVKEVRPVTIATYQVLTTKRGGLYPHLELVDGNDWGLIIYDEVHLLPAPIFRMTADLQARRRLGLTATLVREDGREGEVFSLIGPKRYDAPWKDIEAQGYIAPADCVEVRIDLPRDERVAYAMAEDADKYRLCSTSESKTLVVEQLVAEHAGEQLLVIGQYIDQLDEIGERLQAPVIKGDTSVKERQKLFDAFRAGEVHTLVVSKVANFSIDLPEASVAIQVSGSFGSRQEEAQRLGRLLRPKKDGRAARFYSLVARDTLDQDFAAKRQRFLAEQGYAYRIMDAKDVEAARRGLRTSRPIRTHTMPFRKLPESGSIMGSMKKTGPEAKLLVVDDEPNIRELLSTSLRFAGFEVVSAGNGRDALAAAELHSPDLAVLDVMLPDMDGFTVTRRLRAAGKHFPVLFLTAKDDTEDKVMGLTVGGDDYVTKPFSLDEVVARIRAVLRRTQPLQDDDAVIRVDDLELDDDAHEVRRGGTVIELSPTEFKLLRYLMLNPNRVLSKAQILDHVWEYDFNGDASIVESYISYLRRKVDIDPDAPALIQTKRGVGYVLRTAEKR